MRDYYEILGVPPGADMDQIRAAYRALAKKYHPDLNPDGAYDMAMLNVVYDTLSNARLRHKYDLMNQFNRKILCSTCKGKGQIMKQRGFAKKVAEVCKTCEGKGTV